MSSREVNKLLFDVEKACERILRFIEGRSIEEFLGDEVLQSAVERQSEIIGEALNRAVGLDESLRDRITDLSRIIAFRPVLIAEVRAIMGESR
jgi:uncharacterized protein with HEPN domain